MYVNNCTHPRVKWTVCISNRKVTWGLKNSGSGSRSVKSSKALLSLENVGFDEKKNCERSKNGPLKNDNFGVFLFFLQQTQSELDLLFFFTGKRSHQRLLSQALSSYEAPQFPLNSGVYEVERPKYCRFDGPSSSTRRSPEVWLKFKNKQPSNTNHLWVDFPEKIYQKYHGNIIVLL